MVEFLFGNETCVSSNLSAFSGSSLEDDARGRRSLNSSVIHNVESAGIVMHLELPTSKNFVRKSDVIETPLRHQTQRLDNSVTTDCEVHKWSSFNDQHP